MKQEGQKKQAERLLLITSHVVNEQNEDWEVPYSKKDLKALAQMVYVQGPWTMIRMPMARICRIR